MTGTDLDLLAALFEDPFTSYAELGRRLGMTGQGARKRVVRLQEEGVLRGFVATPVPAIFDREGLVLTVQEAALEVPEALELPDVVLGGRTLEGLSSVVGYVPPGAEATRRAAWRSALGGQAVVYEGAYRPATDPPPLGPLEWRVLRALLVDPRASLAALAEATGLTPRTVGDKRRGLIDQGAVEVTPVVGPSETGRLFFHLAVIGYEGSPRSLAARFPGAVLTERTRVPGGGPGAEDAILFCQASSLADQHRMVRKVQGLPGVQTAIVYLMAEYRVHTERLIGWIDEALDAWSAARRDP